MLGTSIGMWLGIGLALGSMLWGLVNEHFNDWSFWLDTNYAVIPVEGYSSPCIAGWRPPLGLYLTS